MIKYINDARSHERKKNLITSPLSFLKG